MVRRSPDVHGGSHATHRHPARVLSAALAREDGLILPLPQTLKGGALLAKGLAEEVALSRKEAQTAPEKVFRTAEHDQPITLRITALGRKAPLLEGRQLEAPIVQAGRRRSPNTPRCSS
jgi:hypothetical protein